MFAEHGRALIKERVESWPRHGAGDKSAATKFIAATDLMMSGSAEHIYKEKRRPVPIAEPPVPELPRYFDRFELIRQIC
jgi:hypothetical protein